MSLIIHHSALCILHFALTMSTEVQAQARSAEVRRRTKETNVRVRLVLDGGGASQVSTGVAFLDHMLELTCKATARALRQAVERDPGVAGVPSTKGVL